MMGGKMEKLNSIKKPCQAKKPDGSSCQAAALPGSDFCFFHDPNRADERREANAAGGRQGKMKTLSADAPDVKVETCQDVVRLISETINQVRKGDLDPRVANAIGYLANVLIKAAEQGDLEKRVEDLEAVVKMKSRTSDFPMMGMET
jgi:hypothetical protein